VNLLGPAVNTASQNGSEDVQRRYEPQVSIDKQGIHLNTRFGDEIEDFVGLSVEIVALTTESNEVRVARNDRSGRKAKVHVEVTFAVFGFDESGVIVAVPLDFPITPSRETKVYILMTEVSQNGKAEGKWVGEPCYWHQIQFELECGQFYLGV